jgi:hypothetical protein
MKLFFFTVFKVHFRQNCRPIVTIPSAIPVDSTIRATHSGQAGCGVINAKKPITTNQNATLAMTAYFNKITPTA